MEIEIRRPLNFGPVLKEYGSNDCEFFVASFSGLSSSITSTGTASTLGWGLKGIISLNYRGNLLLDSRTLLRFQDSSLYIEEFLNWVQYQL